jgi:hypothetical protein
MKCCWMNQESSYAYFFVKMPMQETHYRKNEMFLDFVILQIQHLGM